MLMTVLKGELAVRQSKALIRTFRQMKDYIVENHSLVEQREFLQLSMQVTTISEVADYIAYVDLINSLLNNPALILK